MNTDIHLKVSKQLNELDSLLSETLKQNIITDRSYTLITSKIGHLDSHYMNEQFKAENRDYYHWVKARLDKLSGLLVTLQKHSTASFSIPNEDLMHVTGDYYNEDNSISLTQEVKNAIHAIINEKFIN